MADTHGIIKDFTSGAPELPVDVVAKMIRLLTRPIVEVATDWDMNTCENEDDSTPYCYTTMTITVVYELMDIRAEINLDNVHAYSMKMWRECLADGRRDGPLVVSATGHIVIYVSREDDRDCDEMEKGLGIELPRHLLEQPVLDALEDLASKGVPFNPQ